MIAQQSQSAKRCQRQTGRIGHDNDARLPELARHRGDRAHQQRQGQIVGYQFAHDERRQNGQQRAHHQADELARQGDWPDC